MAKAHLKCSKHHPPLTAPKFFLLLGSVMSNRLNDFQHFSTTVFIETRVAGLILSILRGVRIAYLPQCTHDDGEEKEPSMSNKIHHGVLGPSRRRLAEYPCAQSLPCRLWFHLFTICCFSLRLRVRLGYLEDLRWEWSDAIEASYALDRRLCFSDSMLADQPWN